jgi:hypothetical protein
MRKVNIFRRLVTVLLLCAALPAHAVLDIEITGAGRTTAW